jgi:hypothetical protein
MNVKQPEKPVPPADKNRVPSAGETANLEEKYEHLEELAKRSFAAKRRHLQATRPPQP